LEKKLVDLPIDSIRRSRGMLLRRVISVISEGVLASRHRPSNFQAKISRPFRNPPPRARARVVSCRFALREA
jgi:hypothetical protein